MAFVQDFQVVDHPYDQAMACLGASADALLSAAFEGARVEGESLRARVGPMGWPPVLSKTVEIRSGPLRHHGGSALIPLHWEATGGASLFPSLDADLEVAPFGQEQSQLVLRARYEPPGGAIGRGLDRVLLHRLAEATLRAFLVSVCAKLDGTVAGQAPGSQA